MTRVVFLYHEANDDLFAIFPDEINSTRGGSKFYMSYSHEGQHSECSMRYIKECRMAQPNEYSDLQYELENLVGYNLEIIESL